MRDVFPSCHYVWIIILEDNTTEDCNDYVRRYLRVIKSFIHLWILFWTIYLEYTLISYVAFNNIFSHSKQWFMVNIMKQYYLDLTPNVGTFFLVYYFTNDTAKHWYVCIGIMHTRILKILCYVTWKSIAFITVCLNIKVWFVAKVLKQYFIIYECVIYILSCLLFYQRYS